MSKKYKGKTCVYCAKSGASETGDHVLARKFVPVLHRSDIPQVPACRPCNKEKSDLEHYLTTVLLFGGRHPDAMTNLVNDGPRRLAKNPKLHRELASGQSRVWSKEPSGVIINALVVPIDGERIKKLVEFIVRGLMFHHWGVVLGSDCFVDVLSLTARGEAFFRKTGWLNAVDSISGNVGNEALVYQGTKGTDNSQISIWEIVIFGGLKMTGDDPQEIASKFGVMTGPKTLKDRAGEMAKSGTFILIP